MKNFKLTILAAVLFGFLQNANAQQLQGVEINGVVWATTNIGATHPEDSGNLYILEDAQTACPEGWRLPTEAEVLKLIYDKKVANKEKIQKGIKGKLLTDEITGASIFLPVIGCTTLSGIPLENSEDKGYYWCTARSIMYIDLAFFSQRLHSSYGSDDGNQLIFYVRCVAE